MVVYVKGTPEKKYKELLGHNPFSICLLHFRCKLLHLAPYVLAHDFWPPLLGFIFYLGF